jgi:hypothetical protein
VGTGSAIGDYDDAKLSSILFQKAQIKKENVSPVARSFEPYKADISARTGMGRGSLTNQYRSKIAAICAMYYRQLIVSVNITSCVYRGRVVS